MIMRHDQTLLRMNSSENALMEIKLSLQGIAMGNVNFTEKLAEMKESLAQISKDNIEQHKELSGRINNIEAAPGKKWERLIWMIISAGVGGIITYVLTNVLK
jgi:hypothetical protein